MSSHEEATYLMSTATWSPPGLEEPAPKHYHSGTHRTVVPTDTVARVRRFMPVMGITRIANVTGLDSIGIPVVVVCRPNSRSISVFQGKGLDLAAAQASGLMESIEAYHAERVSLPLKLASYEELRYTHRVVDVTQLARTPRTPFHPYLPILWVGGYDLLQNEPIWVPLDTVHTNYTVAMRGIFSCFVTSSNGLASGNHILEAISHAVCEVVERDAATIWALQDAAAQRATRIDLATIADRDCCAVLEKYARADIAVGVWEITSDIGIPAFLCRIIDRAENPFRPLYAANGFGCHPLRTIALVRALTEAAQSRLTFISGARDDRFRSDYERLRQPALLQHHRSRIMDPGPARPFTDGPSWQAETLNEDIAWELERLQATGHQRVIVVDLTRPEFRVPVVKVVIPGLEHLASTQNYIPGARARARMQVRE